MRRVLACLVALTSVVACSSGSSSSADSEAKTEQRASLCAAPHPGANTGYVAGGQTRSFELLLPPASFTGPRPLLMAFHGTGETAQSFSDRARLAEFAARGFVVVAPDAVGNGSVWPVWDGMHLKGAPVAANADLALVDSLLDCVGTHYAIDPTRIFAGGHSAGGIFTNHVLRMRSNVFAGGIVASGVFDFTEPTPVPASETLGAMTVIVTWGGDADGFGGWDGSGSAASGFTFVEQAALESKFYASQPAVGQVYCRGNDLGHVWLSLNDWFIDLLVARPKGTSKSTLAITPAPASAEAVCSTGIFTLPPAVPTTCTPVAHAGCREMCQLFADCAVANKSVGTALAGELDSIGLGPGSCGACTDRCNANATTSEDDAVLACWAAKKPLTTCGPGLEGGLPLFDDFAACCNDHPGSRVCADLCATFGGSTLSAFVPICPATRASRSTSSLFESGPRPTTTR